MFLEQTFRLIMIIEKATDAVMGQPASAVYFFDKVPEVFLFCDEKG